MFQVIEIRIDQNWSGAEDGFIGFEQGLDQKAIEKILKRFFEKAFGIPSENERDQAYFKQVSLPVQTKILGHTIDCLAGKFDSIQYQHEISSDEGDDHWFGITIKNWGERHCDGSDPDHICFYWGNLRRDSYIPIKVTGCDIDTKIVDETFCHDEVGPGRKAEIVIADPDDVLGGLVRKFSLKELKDWLVFRFYPL